MAPLSMHFHIKQDMISPGPFLGPSL